jgi:hypothetical protein
MNKTLVVLIGTLLGNVGRARMRQASNLCAGQTQQHYGAHERRGPGRQLDEIGLPPFLRTRSTYFTPR